MKIIFTIYMRILCGFIFLLSYAPGAGAQVIAGIIANGRNMNNGDTIFICRNTAINYQSSAINALTHNWRFNNGSPATSAAVNPGTVNYATAGIDSTVQVVTDASGSDSLFIYVKVSDVYPLAGFNFSPDNVCGNINISFTSTSTGNNITHAWNFADGGTSTLQNPQHQFLNAIGPPGTTQAYNVKLVVTSRDGCKDSISKTVNIKRVPDAAIGNADATVTFGPFNGVPTFRKCSNQPGYTFSFNNQSTTIATNTSYTIKWGDGVSPDSTFTNWPAGVVITHSYPLGGKTMTVEVTGADGCIGIKNYIVFLGSTPSGGLASLGNEDVCEKDTLRFEITNFAGNSPGTTYTFLVNDGSQPQVFQHAPPSIVGHNFTRSSCGITSTSGIDVYPNAFGAYLTIQNPCGSKSPAVVPIYVSGRPVARLRATPSGVVCTGTQVLFQNISQYGANPAQGCANTGVQVWTVTPATGYTLVPAALGSLNGQPDNAVAWTNGPTSFNIQFNTPGTYTIKLYISNLRCGVDSTTRTICVRNPPQASFTMPRDSSCGPAIIQFTNTSPAGGCNGDVYNWQVQYQDPQGCGGNSNPPYNFSTGNANSASPAISFNKPGIYIITLTVRSNGALGSCPQAVFTDTFVVKGPPVITLTPPGTICPNNNINPAANVTACYSNGPLGCQWTFTGGSPAAATACNPGPVLYSSTGNYAVSLTVTDSSCPLSTTVTDTVRVVNPPAADAGPDKDYCSGGNIQIGSSPVAGLTYTWGGAAGLSSTSIANPVVSFVYNGPSADTVLTYYVDVAANATCRGADTVKVTVKRSPVVTAMPAAVGICKDSSITLTATGADTYTWQPGGATTAAITVSPAATTSYIVTGTLNNGCFAKDTVPVTVSVKARAEFTLLDSVYCAPLVLDTVISVTPYPGINAQYNWYVDGILQTSNTSGAPPALAVNTPGDTLLIKLVTTSAAGCAPDSLQRRLITRPSVTALFSKDTASGCGPLRVTFTNQSQPANNNAVQYSWIFGNGTTSPLQQPPPVIYTSSPGFRDTTYYITLKVYAGCDTSYYRDSVKVFPGPSARFSVNPTTLCSNDTFKVINNSLGNGTAFYWDFDDGTLDTTYFTTDTLIHKYNTGIIDTFRIRLIAINGCGRDTQYLSIVVTPSTIQPIIVVGGNSQFGCAPHTAVFTNNSLGAAVLYWDYGDGSIPEITPNQQSTVSHLYQNPGVYTANIRLRNDCTDTTVQRQITVYPRPQASFLLSRNLVCPGDTMSVTSTSLNANALEWLWGDGSTGAGLTATHIYNNPGVYNIRLVAKRLNNFGLVCSDTSAPQQVTVQANIPAVMALDTTKKLCAPYTFNATAQGAAGASIVRWTVTDPNTPPGIFIINGVTLAYNFIQPGNYSVKLFTQNAAGCKDSVVKNFTVYPIPAAQFTPGNQVTCLADTIVRYSATYNYAWADPISLQWYVNAQPVGVGTVLNYQFRLPPGASRPYTFTVRLLPQNAAGCGDSTAPATVTIKPVPVPGIKVLPGYVQRQPNRNFDFSDSSAASPNYAYRWDMGDRSPLRDLKAFQHQFPDTGTYLVRLRVHDFQWNCTGNDSARVTVLYVPGYLYVPNAFYPNSRKDQLKEFKPVASGLETYHLRIYDTWGKLVFETRLLDSDGKPAEAWNGRDKQGREMPGDTYVWVIDATFKNGLVWEGMIYDRTPNQGPPPKPTRQSFVQLFR